VAARLRKDRRVTVDHFKARGRLLRHTFGMGATAACVELMLDYQPPYDWAAFLRFMGPRAIPGIERVEADSYHRSKFTVRRHPRGNCLVAINAAKSMESQIRFFFDLGADPRPIAAHLAKSRLLKRIVARHPGLRVPRCWDPFELAVRAMLGQQVTVKGASTLAGRLVERFGPPQAAILAEADLAAIGLPKARVESIRGFARAVCDQRIRFDGAVSSQEMIGRMCELPGIGPWTANYIAMRALGDPDAFPASDLGLLKAAQASSPRRLAELAERWRPWRSYAAMYLWELLHDDE
jgi:3-methyladenine DNA glycosylase/8-oxoguanine DNA glycosylase